MIPTNLHHPLSSPSSGGCSVPRFPARSLVRTCSQFEFSDSTERFRSSRSSQPSRSKLIAPPHTPVIGPIIQVRPVCIYHQHKISGVLFPEHVLGLLQSLKLWSRPLTELRKFICWKDRGFLQILASEILALCRLELYVRRHRYDPHAVRDGKIDWEFLTNSWPESEATVENTKLCHLQVVRVCLALPKARDPPKRFPIDRCRI